MLVKLLQMVSGRGVGENLLRAETLINEAVRDKPLALFLPENFAALAGDDPLKTGMQENNADGPIRQFLSDQAKAHGVWLFAGSLPMAIRADGTPVPGNRVRAASLVYDPAGELCARYDKIHMFDVDVADNQGSYRESDTFEPGDEIVCVSTPFGQVGLSVCYDVRFPGVYRTLVDKGAEVLLVPSAFTRVTGQAHFEVLLRSRAIETFSYVIAACQGGDHDSGRQTYGNSMVIDPWGEVIARAGMGEAIVSASIDLKLVAACRSKMPVHLQRRL